MPAKAYRLLMTATRGALAQPLDRRADGARQDRLPSSRGAALVALEALGAIPSLSAPGTPGGAASSPIRGGSTTEARKRQYHLYDQIVGRARS